ncbi:M1 family metallopeptidase [Pontibacter cellulosilyticus]|uniref:Aminopeptidase N n=1 Tax=Pontibacter cellulosilyticus TaxID=1720253 RepID=A0A923N418_9BACT|nr:M1 family aminopeptidase [Pontibacter cellulosilyticus]MBC5991317.1 ERAP1-like C-terminal domain-containing protein [Pontibacter cellulosilyticus]
MKQFTFSALKTGAFSLALLAAVSCSQTATQSNTLPVETGVAQQLAQYRQQVLQNINYNLHFSIPEKKEDPIAASEVISFNLSKNQHPLQLDFKEQASNLKSIKVNNKSIPVAFENEHVIIDKKYLKEGENTVAIDFIAGNLSLNRNDDYLYTLLVPDRARTVFPVFDQPDLKATFTLTLTIPQKWKAVANAPLKDIVAKDQQKTYRFQDSDTISTYLFSFVAGDFDLISRQEVGRPMNFYHRETDSSKLKLSIDPIFKIHADALGFMEDYTQIPYPFKKFDFVAIPDFQYGGMEHVGVIDYKASTLFLDEGATKDQRVSRSNLIAHETAHMWFGDLVTMQWFNDVWMKEVFANFMADKISQVTMADANYELKFLLDHFPAAYSIDRTAGANPIRQQLDNLQDAGSLYGHIIYHKAPIMMRQLERLMGEVAFKEGLREYLKKYANSNATWPNLIEILDARTPVDLQAWNQVWVNEPGRPQIAYELKTDKGKITSFSISQQGEDGSDRLWPQIFEVALVYKDRVEELTINMDQKQLTVENAIGKQQPEFILFNSSGQGYGQFPVDKNNLAAIARLQDPVMRAAAYINLYESMLSGRGVAPELLLAFTLIESEREPEELNLKLLTSYTGDIFWRFIRPGIREKMAPAFEKKVWDNITARKDPNSKKLLFKTYQNIALTPEATKRLYQVWKTQQPPEGVKLTEDDYTSLALSLALREYPDGNSILNEQLKRIKNPDRQKRLQFMMPALSADVKVRDAFFASLKEEQNREKEAWVASALGYLHHPLRSHTSEKYLQQSLELLEEIQLTGDIFFPTNWLNATFGSYQSPEAAAVIRKFLQEHPKYNPKLRGKILQAADNVYRAEKLLQQQQ